MSYNIVTRKVLKRERLKVRLK